MHQLTIEPPAEADIIDAMQFYEAQHPRLGTRFLHQLNAQLQRIGKIPINTSIFGEAATKRALTVFRFWCSIDSTPRGCM